MLDRAQDRFTSYTSRSRCALCLIGTCQGFSDVFEGVFAETLEVVISLLLDMRIQPYPR